MDNPAPKTQPLCTVTMSLAAKDELRRLEEEAKHLLVLDSLPTGFPVLDGCIGQGIRPGELLVIGGPRAAEARGLGWFMAATKRK